MSWRQFWLSWQGEWGAADPLGGGQRWLLSVRRPEGVPVAQGVPGAEVEKKPRSSVCICPLLNVIVPLCFPSQKP